MIYETTAELARVAVANVRRHCVLESVDRVLQLRPRSRERAWSLDGQAEALPITIACSEPPESCAGGGCTCWRKN